MDSSTPAATAEAPVTDEQRTRFLEDGFLRLDRMIEPDELERLRTIYDRCFSDDPPEGLHRKALGGFDEQGRDASPQVLGPQNAFPELHEMRYYQRVEAAARFILGDEAHQRGEHMIYKPARYGTETPWHQDQAYHNPNYRYCNINFWLPLDGATIEGGCMHFVRGSHKGPILPHEYLDPNDTQTALVASGQDHWHANGTPVPCPEGSVTLHHSYMLHYAGPNVSETPRRAYIIVWRLPAEKLERPWQLLWQPQPKSG